VTQPTPTFIDQLARLQVASLHLANTISFWADLTNCQTCAHTIPPLLDSLLALSALAAQTQAQFRAYLAAHNTAPPKEHIQP
jgi:hypothetical protein